MHLYGTSDNPPMNVSLLTFLSHATLYMYCPLSLTPYVSYAERSPFQSLFSEVKCFFYRVEGTEKFCEKTPEGRQWLITAQRKMGGQIWYIKSASKKVQQKK